MVDALLAGTTRYPSSAYMKYLFKGEKGTSDEDVRLKRVGPKTEPCMTPAVVLAETDSRSWKLVTWDRFVIKSRIQLCI